MKSFNSYINEEFLSEASTTESTLMESVIVDLWNIFKGNPNIKFEDFQKMKKNKKSIFEYINRFAGKNKLPKNRKEAAKTIFNFGRNLYQKGIKISGVAQQSGTSNVAVSPTWSEIANKKIDTSKADIVIGDAGISVKNGTGARLMSGVKAETKATIISALEHSGADVVVKKKLFELVNKFASNTEILMSEVLKTGETGELKKTDISSLKLDANKKAKMVLNDALMIKDKCGKMFGDIFANNPKFRNSFAYEAATGWEKFGGKVFKTAGDDSGRATWLLAYSPDLSKVRIEHLKSVSSKVVTEIAKKMSFAADMKSGSFQRGGSVLGYRFSQTAQLRIKTEFDELDKLQTTANEQIEKWESMLSEGMIEEGWLWDKIKSIGNWLWNGIKRIFGKVMNIIKEYVTIFTQALSEGVNGIWGFFDLDVSASHNTEFKLL